MRRDQAAINRKLVDINPFPELFGQAYAQLRPAPRRGCKIKDSVGRRAR
jgi:hypothetical protein